MNSLNDSNFLKDYDSVFQNEILEFLKTYMISSEGNNGYRYFPHNAIKIYPKERKIIFNIEQHQAHYGTSNFSMRTEADNTFLHYKNKITPVIQKENNMFSFQKSELPDEYTPSFGGRAAITLISLYTDKKGKTYISIPLTNNEEVYKYAGKLSGGGVIRDPKMKNILRDSLKSKDPSSNPWNKNKQENNNLFLKEKGSIKKILDDFQIGDWTLQFNYKKGNKSNYERINGVHSYRAHDGTFEFLKTQTFFSEYDVLNYFSPTENISFKRPVVLVELEQLGDFYEGGNLLTEKIFFSGKEINIEDIPDGFKQKFLQDGEKVLLKEFSLTPPLRAFIQQLKISHALELYKNKLIQQLEKGEINANLRAHEVGEQAESDFGEQVKLSKNTEQIKYNIHIPENFKTIIINSNLSAKHQDNLINYIEKHNYKNKDSVVINPDFITEIDNNTFYIEHKNSVKSIKKHQLYNFFIIKLFSNSAKNLNYIQAIGSNYNSSVDFGLGAIRESEKKTIPRIQNT